MRVGVVFGLALTAACGSSRGEDIGSSDASESQLIIYDDGRYYCITQKTTCSASDPFESALAELGCKGARITDYGDKPGNVWKAAACPPSQELDDLVTSYANQQPYLAQYSLKPCTAWSPPAAYVWVSWDPTCPTCSIPIPPGARVYQPN
jgi:hypothetical protein